MQLHKACKRSLLVLLTVCALPDLSMAQTRRKLNAQGISYVCQLFR